MARKRKCLEEVNHERWLVSYADFITLLFALFVLMFAASNSDEKKVGKIAKAVQVAFKEMAVFTPVARVGPLYVDAGLSSNTTTGPGTAHPIFQRYQFPADKRQSGGNQRTLDGVRAQLE